MKRNHVTILFSTLYLVISMMLLVGCAAVERAGAEVDAPSNEAADQMSMADRHLFHDRLELDRAIVVTSGPVRPGTWDRVDRIRFQDRRDLPVLNPVAPVVKRSMTMLERHQFHDRLWASQPGGSD